jgi:polyether ionophore transport system permease protein
MTTEQLTRPAPGPAPAVRRPARLHAERAGFGLAVRQIWLGGLVVAAATGLLLWLGVDAFHKSKTSGGGLMYALANIPAMRAVYGPPTAIHTVGGFAVWRVAIFVMFVGTVWMVLATTRVLRGNEETGRMDLVLAEPISLTRDTVVSLAALLSVPLLSVIVVGSVLQGLGAAAAGSWLYAAGIGLLFATFMAVAALASQLMPERRRAVGIATGVLLATFVLRMWADGGDNAAWVRWLTPFGWVENLHAFGGNDLLPLIPLVVTPVVLVAVALVLVRRRDAGAGMVRAADTNAGASIRLLSTPLALATRRRIGELAAWGLGLVVLGLLSGGLSESFVGFAQKQPDAYHTLVKFGLAATVTPGGFVAMMDMIYAVVLAGYAIACLHGDYDDETTNRLDLPYSNRITRTGWAGSTVVTVTAALMALTVLLGLATWAGSALAGAGLSAGDSLSAAANVLPVSIFFLGLAMLLHGVRPSWTVGVTGVLAIGLYMVELIGPALDWSRWVLDLSPYHHLALVPAEAAAWTALIVMLSISIAATALGLLSYAHRDLQ